MISEVEYLPFHVHKHICMSSVGKYLFTSSAHFLIRLFVFFIGSLYILNTNPYQIYVFVNVFSHIADGAYILLMVPFAVQRLFTLI